MRSKFAQVFDGKHNTFIYFWFCCSYEVEKTYVYYDLTNRYINNYFLEKYKFISNDFVKLQVRKVALHFFSPHKNIICIRSLKKQIWGK